MAARYGTPHFAEEVTPSVVNDLPRLVSALDEPADPLSICLLHLARMTALTALGWDSLVLWECTLRDQDALLSRAEFFLGPTGG